MAKVYVGVPNLGSIQRNVASVLLNLQATARSLGHQIVRFDLSEAKPIDHNRNKIVNGFLRSNADYLFFMDADNPPIWDQPGRNPLFLLDLDLDIVGLPTPIFYANASMEGRWPISWNVYDYNGEKWVEHPNRDGLQEVDAIGTGCLFIARRVLEKVIPAFKRIWNPDGTVDIGSDLLFSRRSKEAGFKVWAHFGFPCQHIKPNDVASFWLALKGRDIATTTQKDPNSPKHWDKKWLAEKPVSYPYYDMIAELAGDLKVLDFGCGRGDLLSKLGKNAEGLDYSTVAVEICRVRGLKAKVGTEIEGQYDVIVATDVLQTLEDDEAMIETFFEHTSTVILSVPHNCFPPGVRGENLRVYTRAFVERNFPDFRGFILDGEFDLVFVLSREEVLPWERQQEPQLSAAS